MIKEKDYPHFCKPEGKDAFERFLRDFNIVAPTTLPRKERYKFWRECRYPGYEGYAFDHVSFWRGYDEENCDEIYYVVSQYCNGTEKAIEELQKDMPLRWNAAKYEYEATIYEDGRYNWHNPENKHMVSIIFKLNEPWKIEQQKEAPHLKITVYN